MNRRAADIMPPIETPRSAAPDPGQGDPTPTTPLIREEDIRDGFGRPWQMLAAQVPGLMPPIRPGQAIRLRSTNLAVREAVQRLCAECQEAGIDADACGRFELVLAEVLNNVVEHAYAESDSGWIVVEIDMLPGWLACRVWDGGTPMPGGALPNPRPHFAAIDIEGADKGPLGPEPCPEPQADIPFDLDDLPEGGFGWSLIRDLTDRLEYERVGGRNCLFLALDHSGGAAGTVA